MIKTHTYTAFKKIVDNFSSENRFEVTAVLEDHGVISIQDKIQIDYAENLEKAKLLLNLAINLK